MKCSEIDIILVCLISLLGCIWQLVDISKLYFSYETNMNIEIKREKVLQLPGVTICTNVSLTIREDYMIKRYPHLREQIENQATKYYTMDELLKNLTLYEQLNEATVGYEQVFNSCLVSKPVAYENNTTGERVNCHEIVPIREYITYSRKCFFIASQLSNESNDRYQIDHDAANRDNSFPLFKIILNPTHTEETTLFITSRNSPFLNVIGGQSTELHLNNTKYSIYSLSYTKTTFKLMKPPYETNCRDYNSIGYASLSHCIISCKANYYIDNFKGWHTYIPASKEYNLNVNFLEEKLRDNITLDKIISERCSRTCGEMNDCESEYYTISIVEKFESEQDFELEGLYQIFIYLPNGLNIRYVHSPRLHLVEYICLFASSFSFWFGLSIITISKGLIKAYKLYKMHPILGKKDKNENIPL